MGEKSRDRNEKFARDNGYPSFAIYEDIMRTVSDKRRTDNKGLQEGFENEMESWGPTLTCTRIVDDTVREIYSDIGVEEAMEIMEGKNYGKGGVVRRNRVNPNGRKFAYVLRRLYWDGESQDVVAKSMGIERGRVGQLRDDALEHLRDILTKKNFR